MPTGKQIITEANKYLGESSKRFTSWYGVSSSTAWCCIFVSYVLNKAGYTKFGKFAYCPYAWTWLAKNATRVKLSEAKAGDVVIFTWSGVGGNNKATTAGGDHIGFIKSRNSNGTFNTIEGNTSNSICANRVRYASNIRGIFRLPGLSSSSSTKKTTSSKKTISSTKKKTTTTTTKFVVNKTYTVTAADGLNVRKGPGTNYAKVKRANLTADAKKHAYNGTYGVLKKGTKVTCLAVKNGWVKIPSGWVSGKYLK